MKKTLSKKAKALIAICVVFSILALSVGGFFLYVNMRNARNSVKFDYRLGAIAAEQIETAQYTPDIDKYLQANKPVPMRAARNASASKVATDAGQEEFTALIDEYATVYNYAGAGKYLGYDVYEIKEELAFVVEKAPAFNQWFRMPIMREKEGFTSIPYYESWAYYLEIDEETSALSVTRVCWATRSKYLDFKNKKSVEDHSDGSSFNQFEIMKTNYLKTETDEIVECFIYSVGVDHVKSSNDLFSSMVYYQNDPDDYYPFEYQYLRNVKDKSMVKYHITAAERCSAGEAFDEGGMDIRGRKPYGVRREYMVVNYDGYIDIDVTKIDQKFNGVAQSKQTDITGFDVNGNNIRILTDAVGLDADIADLSFEEFSDVISKHIVDNFELKNNWPSIYKNSAAAPIIDTIYGPYYQKDILVTDVHTYIETLCRNDMYQVKFDAYATVYDSSKFDFDKEYSLSMALKSRETGQLTVIATSYAVPLQDNRLYTNSLTVTPNQIKVDEDGTYDVVCVLTVRENNQDVILFETYTVALLRRYQGLQIPSREDENGNVQEYTVSGTGKKLVITVKTVTEQSIATL